VLLTESEELDVDVDDDKLLSLLADSEELDWLEVVP
jgi:hypothetical protein